LPFIAIHCHSLPFIAIHCHSLPFIAMNPVPKNAKYTLVLPYINGITTAQQIYNEIQELNLGHIMKIDKIYKNQTITDKNEVRQCHHMAYIHLCNLNPDEDFTFEFLDNEGELFVNHGKWKVWKSKWKQ
jgi:hypothetical protein